MSKDSSPGTSTGSTGGSNRPNPFQWIAYAYGARLPQSQRDWVRKDLTGPYAVPRHLFRSQFAFLPIYLVLYFGFPGPWEIRAAMVGLTVSLAFIFSAAYMHPNRARRLQKNGLDQTLTTARRKAVVDAEKAEYETLYGRRRSTVTGPAPRSIRDGDAH